MPQPRFYDFGEVKGSVGELATHYGVDKGTMQGRLQRYNEGKIGLDAVLVYGMVKIQNAGTAEWHGLSDMPEGRPENLAKIKVGIFDNI